MRGANKVSICVALLLSVFYLAYTKAGHTQSQVFEYMTTSVSVNSIFTMSASQPSLNFGNVGPGKVTTETREFNLYCETNNNNMWELSIYLLSPLTSDGSTIPNDGFNWWGWTVNGSGTWYAGGGNLDTVPHTFYSAGSGEGITPLPIQFVLQFNIDKPASQPVGVYTTSLIIKMRDTTSGEEVERIVYVTVGVNPTFAMSVSPTSLHFDNTAPGTTTETKTIYISCSTNNNTPWSLKMRVLSELTSGTYTIPNQAFKWNGSSQGSGIFYPGTGSVDTTPFTFYEAGVNEYVTPSPVEGFMNFYVEVPPTQVAGTYTTTLVLTMTE